MKRIFRFFPGNLALRFSGSSISLAEFLFHSIYDDVVLLNVSLGAKINNGGLCLVGTYSTDIYH